MAVSSPISGIGAASDGGGITFQKRTTIMSTEARTVACDLVMESQGAATASSVPRAGRTRPMLAAVQPAVEAASEPLSFDAFYRREHRHVLGLAFVLTGNQAVAEDIAQDAFTAAFRHWRSVAAYDSPGAWVRRVTCNQAASVLRRRARGEGIGATGSAHADLYRTG